MGTTHAPVEATANPRPEWIRVSPITKLFGISRSIAYELMAAGQIKSSLIRKRGAVKGIRLISADSVREFLEAQAGAPNRV